MDSRARLFAGHLDQVVILECRQRLFDGVDVFVDDGSDLEDGHSLFRALHESVQHRDLRIRTIAELRLGLHVRANDGNALTVTAAFGVIPARAPRVRREEHLFPHERGSQRAMGLRCLLGHDFGDAEIEREREEDGDEMVVTIREIETCRRCGAERIISENKEVTSIRTAEELGLETDEGDASAAPPNQADAVTSETAGESDPTGDSETADEGDPAAAGQADTADRDDAAGQADSAAAGATADADSTAGSSTADAGPAADASSTADEEFDDPDVDDGVILSEEDEQRGHGEWPEAEQEGGSAAPQSGSEAEPDSENVNQGEGTQPSAGVDADAEAAPEADDQADEQPSVADGEDDDVEILDADDDASDAIDSATNDTRSTPDSDATDSAAGMAGSAADEADEAAAWPDHGGEDEGFDAEIAGDEDVSFSGNSLTPDVEADAPGADAEYVETDGDTGRDSTDRVAEATRQTDVDTGIAREGAATVDLSEVDDDAEFYCPNCGLSRGSGNSSMRPGDICPECRKGYIAER